MWFSERPKHILNKSCGKEIPALVNQICKTGVKERGSKSTHWESDLTENGMQREISFTLYYTLYIPIHFTMYKSNSKPADTLQKCDGEMAA